MYRILLADDEGIMLESLRSMITRQFTDSVEIETAKTGRAAIEIAEYFHPDIVLMDIQMPGLNGIQAMKEIRRFNSTALFYIISAYDTFDYAKEAISLGVERYLMKPVTRSTIIEIMEEAIRKVDETRQRRSDQLKVQEKLETIIPVVENGFVSSMLLAADGQDMEYYRQLLEFTEDYGYVIVYQFGTKAEDGRLVSPVGVSVEAQAIYPEFRAIIKSFSRCIIGAMMTDRVVTVVPVEESVLDYEARVDLINQARQTVSRLEERLPLHFRAAIGRTKALRDLRASYQEALIALSESSSRVVHSNDILTRGVYEGDFPIETEKEMFAALTRGDLEGMTRKANWFYDWMIRKYPDAKDNIRLKVLEYVLEAEKLAFHEGAVNYGFEFRKSYLTEVMALDDYEQLREWYMHKMTAACRSIMTRKEERSESVVSKAKYFMQENYSKDISLDEVSREVNVSPYYFSKLFKEEAGENFIEYLTRVRIEHARELLRTRNHEIPVKEIGMQVGYADPNYFSRIFKKQTGMTPREYRESL